MGEFSRSKFIGTHYKTLKVDTTNFTRFTVWALRFTIHSHYPNCTHWIDVSLSLIASIRWYGRTQTINFSWSLLYPALPYPMRIKLKNILNGNSSNMITATQDQYDLIWCIYSIVYLLNYSSASFSLCSFSLPYPLPHTHCHFSSSYRHIPGRHESNMDHTGYRSCSTAGAGNDCSSVYVLSTPQA